MILAHPQVQQVFIVPLDDAEYGQRPVAVVECDDGCEMSALAAWSAERLARFQQPVRWLRLPETLKTAGLRFRAGRCANGSIRRFSRFRRDAGAVYAATHGGTTSTAMASTSSVLLRLPLLMDSARGFWHLTKPGSAATSGSAFCNVAKHAKPHHQQQVKSGAVYCVNADGGDRGDGRDQKPQRKFSIRVNRPISAGDKQHHVSDQQGGNQPQTISGCSVNIAGPGVMLYSVSAPIITAVVPDPGTPSVSMGIKEPQAEALLAASGAATPRISPLPKLSLLPLSFSRHVGNGAGDSPRRRAEYRRRNPPPRSAASRRRTLCGLFGVKQHPSGFPHQGLSAAGALQHRSAENKPITTTINCTPSERWTLSKVKR